MNIRTLALTAAALCGAFALNAAAEQVCRCTKWETVSELVCVATDKDGNCTKTERRTYTVCLDSKCTEE